MLQGDKIITNVFDKLVITPLDFIFRHIHPNVITITSMVLNYFIYISILNRQKQKALILLWIRYMTDNLDGHIARKYGKTSKIGGLLDTIADI